MKNRNRINRKERPPIQGYKDYKTGETHKPYNNHDPRVGIAKWKRHRKCHCESCGGNKRNKIAESENWKENWKKEVI